MLSFICSYFNFTDSPLIRKNYEVFRRSFDYPLTTIELALPEQNFFIDDSIKIKVDSSNILWQKERCLNLAIEQLPPNIDSIAWIDTDIIFDNRHLLQDTYKALERNKVVQLFEKCEEKPIVNHYNNNISLGKKIKDNIAADLPCIGFAWAFRREILIEDKLYDSDPVGNSDVLQILSWLGQWNNASILDLNPQYRKEFLLWAWNSYEKVQRDIGYVKGSVRHLYHGPHYGRKYHDRNKILTSNNFVPSEDLRINSDGLYSIPYKKHLLEDIKSYFMDRKNVETVY